MSGRAVAESSGCPISRSGNTYASVSPKFRLTWRRCAVPERSITLAATKRKGWRASERKETPRMARRHFQTGCLTKKGKAWVFRYREYQIQSDGTVRPVHKSISLGRVKWSEAVQTRDEFLRRHELHGNRPRAAMTLNDFWSQYFQPQIVQKKRLNTQKLYGHLYRNHISTHLGGLKLCDLGRYDIQAF